MSEFTSRCYRCMQPIKTAEDVCPHCGHDNHMRTSGYGYLPACVLQNQYLVGHALGRGGFGITYIGYDLMLDRIVAVKEYFPADMTVRINNSFSLSAFSDCESAFREGCERALRESRIAARLQNIPGVVQIYNAFPANNTIYIVMEYVDGETFTQYLDRRGGKLPWCHLLPLMNPVMDTLIRLHKADIVHRDIKPENIMIRRSDNTPVLLDFGAAHTVTNATISHSTTLSQGYAPLEQYSAVGAIDGRLDQYALCATMLRALTGRCPMEATLRVLNPDAHIIDCTPENGLSETARAAILRGFSTLAKDRFDSVTELKAELNAGSSAAEAKAKAEAEGRARAAAEARAKAKAEARAKAAAEARAKAEAEARAKTAAEAKAEARAKAAAEARAKAEAEGRARAAAEARAKAEAEARAKAAAEAKAKAEAEGRARAAAEAKAKAEAEARAKAAAEAKAKAEEEVRAGAAAEAKAKAEEEVRAGDTAEAKANTEASTAAKTAAVTEEQAGKKPKSRLIPALLCTAAIMSAGYGYVNLAQNGETPVPAFLHPIVFQFKTESWSDDTLKITDYTGKDENVVVPARIGGKSVTAIGYGAFYNCEALTQVNIPDSVTAIGYSAFNNCEALTQVNIPDSVTAIGDSAFNDCEALTQVNIPDSVTSIGNKVFYGCEALTQLYIPSSVTSIGKDAFDDCPHLTLTVERGSAAEKYARDNGIPFVSLTPAEQFETALREDGTLMITEFIGKDENIVVPAKIGGKTVTAIDALCFYRPYSTSRNSPIRSIRLPDTIQFIGESAFMSTDITEMEIPASVTIMEGNPFWWCDQLKNITIAPGNAQFSLQDSCLIENGAEPRLIAMIDTQAATASIPQGIRIIGEYAFFRNPSLTHVTIPDSVKSIAGSAFAHCEALTEINIPGSVTSIDDYAFTECRGLKQVNILDSVTSIGESAFSFCGALTEINIPDSVTSIDDYTFYMCSGLKQVNILGSVTSIGEGAFSFCEALTEINIPDSVTSIGEDAFSYCEALTEINIPDSVTSIGNRAFYGCKALTQVFIPDSVTFIGNDAFGNCPNLTLIVERGSAAEEYANINGNRFIYVTPAEQFESYTKSNGTVEISAYIGDEESVVIPASIGRKKVTSIQGFATMYCRVKEIQLPNTIEKLNLSAFELALNDTFEIPASVTEITGTLATCSITVAPGNTRFRVENSCLIENGHETRLICGFGAKAKTFVIPEGVTVIGEEAFDYLGYLTRITIPNSVTTIEDRAFEHCEALMEIVLPDSLTSIGNSAFSNCNKLTKISIPDSVTSIDALAFAYCRALRSIVIPASVTSIGKNAFAGCSKLTMTVERGSAAEKYAQENDVPFCYAD